MEEDSAAKIKQAAIDVFTQKGYREAKITDIAEKAGVAVGTIYKNYKGKKELFESLDIPELKEYRPGQSQKISSIIKIALTVFKKYGYNGTSMDQIAQECGFTKAVLYQYFDSKEELFKAIFREPDIPIDIDSIFIEYAYESPEKVLVKIGTIFMNYFEEEDRMNITKMVISESSRFPQLGKIMYDFGINKIAEKLSDYLEMLNQRGIINCPDTKISARSYFGLLYSFVLTNKVFNPADIEFSNDEVIEYASNLFMNSFKK